METEAMSHELLSRCAKYETCVYDRKTMLTFCQSCTEYERKGMETEAKTGEETVTDWKPTYTQEVVDGKVFRVCTVPSGDFGTCTTRGVDLEATMKLQFELGKKEGRQELVDWIKSHGIDNAMSELNYNNWIAFLKARGLK